MAYTTIKKPSDYFNTKLYNGTGSSNAVTGVGFQPDWVWLKSRSNANDHKIFDVVRGVPKFLSSNLTNAEATTSYFSSIDSDGFTVTGNSTAYNESGQTYASWNWLGANNTASNTDGSITSTVSANTTSGFSIVKWTGTGSGQSNVTIGHGLNTIPKVVLFKQLDTGNWVVYHEQIGKDKYLVLNTTDAEASATGLCNPTSTNIVLETSYGGTNSTAGMIAYCFAEKKGFSKFGSYTGNGSTDGTFVYTGFKPAWVMIKNASNAFEEWGIWDSKRDVSNIVTRRLVANITAAENTSDYLDFTSNGFKIRTSANGLNQSGSNLIYMAFAEEPLVGDNPTTAR